MSSEYGWSTDYILTRTLFEIDWRIRSINKRVDNDINFQLAIRGIPVSKKTGEKKEKNKKLTPEQEMAMEIALERAKKRKAEEYGRKTCN